MKRILVTGTTGYIATSFCTYMEQFSDAYEVQTISLWDEKWKELDFSYFDAVVHAAGLAHVRETKENASLYQTVNCDLTVAVAEKAKADGVKQFVFLSSMSVYGMDEGVVKSDTVPVPKSCYGKSKLMAEQRILELESESFSIAILRPPMVYGPGCKGNYVTLSGLARKLQIFPKIENQRSMLYIENLCCLLKSVIDREEKGVFFPQNQEYVRTTDLVCKIASVHGKKILCLPGFSGLVRFMSKRVNAARKAFGSLVYEKKLSGDLASYQVCEFEESVRRTEIKKN